MRKITREIVYAFEYGRTLKIGNSRTDGNALYLFNNKIAEHKFDGLWISNAGWQSTTTKERLNGLRGVRINQVRGQWYLNGYAWDGEWVNVDEFMGSTNGAVEQVPDEVEFNVTCELTGNFDSPIYSVFHAHNESALESVEEALNRQGIPNRRMESDTAGEWRPNHFVVVRPEDLSKAVNILSELYCLAG
jgi:hypothetical protein